MRRTLTWTKSLSGRTANTDAEDFARILPKGSKELSSIVHTWALKGLPYRYFGLYSLPKVPDGFLTGEGLGGPRASDGVPLGRARGGRAGDAESGGGRSPATRSTWTPQ